jgi:hypothetical protein
MLNTKSIKQNCVSIGQKLINKKKILIWYVAHTGLELMGSSDLPPQFSKWLGL